MAEALHLRFRGFVRTYPRHYATPPAGFDLVSTVKFGERAIVGRAVDANIVLCTRDVSRKHCVIDGTRRPFLVGDLDSTSGTRLNGRVIDKPMPLSPGDELGIGQVLLLVHEDKPLFGALSVEEWGAELNAKHRDRRWQAAEAIASAGGEARDVLERLMFALGDAHPPVRRYVARALGMTGEPRALTALTSALDEDDDLVAIEIIRALGRFEEKAEDAVLPLTGLLGRPRLDFAASRTLSRIGEPAVPALLDMLHDPRPRVVQLVVQALADIGEASAAALPDLVRLARHDDSDVRRDVLRALAKMGEHASGAVTTLFDVIDRDDDHRVRAWATSALGAAARDTRYEPKAVAELMRALEDPELRFSAIVALGRLGPSARVAVTSLRRIAGGSRELYAKAAREALASVEASP